MLLSQEFLNMHDEDLLYLRDLVHERTGLFIRDWGLDDLAVAMTDEMKDPLEIYLSSLEAESTDSPRWSGLLSKLTRSFSTFPRHLKTVRVLNEVLEQGGLSADQLRRLKIWSAACAGGEEPHAIAMALFDRISPGVFDFEIAATDINLAALETGRSGVYSEQKLAFVPDEWRSFFQLAAPPLEGARIAPEIAAKIEWSIINLNLADQVSAPASSDIIICRNVLCYFSDTATAKFLALLAEKMTPGAFLITDGGDHFEGLLRANGSFQPLELPSGWVWRKRAS
jgi:chemotaxis protein methyltransferase CheR